LYESRSDYCEDASLDRATTKVRHMIDNHIDP
jgi:hypothetical protein